MFNLSKDEQEKGVVVDAIVEKQINFLNESLRQEITLGKGVGSFGANTTFVC
jgi:hypothetical protein